MNTQESWAIIFFSELTNKTWPRQTLHKDSMLNRNILKKGQKNLSRFRKVVQNTWLFNTLDKFWWYSLHLLIHGNKGQIFTHQNYNWNLLIDLILIIGSSATFVWLIFGPTFLLAQLNSLLTASLHQIFEVSAWTLAVKYSLCKSRQMISNDFDWHASVNCKNLVPWPITQVADVKKENQKYAMELGRLIEYFSMRIGFFQRRYGPIPGLPEKLFRFWSRSVNLALING